MAELGHRAPSLAPGYLVLIFFIFNFAGNEWIRLAESIVFVADNDGDLPAKLGILMVRPPKPTHYWDERQNFTSCIDRIIGF